jgi:hypothetical protein
VSECDAATLGTQNLFGAGVGGMPRQLPEGLAMKLQAGSQLLLNLHLFNVTDQPLSGHSGSWIREIDEKDVKTLADGVVAGPVKLSVPPGRSMTTGTCTFNRDGTLFGIMPHMHQLGVAMRVVAHSPARADVVLFDGPYSFDNQVTYPIDMLKFQAGDTVDITCIYENPTDQTRHWGESTKDEMCVAGLGRFPAGGQSVCPK